MPHPPARPFPRSPAVPGRRHFREGHPSWGRYGVGDTPTPPRGKASTLLVYAPAVPPARRPPRPPIRRVVLGDVEDPQPHNAPASPQPPRGPTPVPTPGGRRPPGPSGASQSLKSPDGSPHLNERSGSPSSRMCPCCPEAPGPGPLHSGKTGRWHRRWRRRMSSGPTWGSGQSPRSDNPRMSLLQ